MITAALSLLSSLTVAKLGFLFFQPEAEYFRTSRARIFSDIFRFSKLIV